MADDELYIINILCLHDALERGVSAEEGDSEEFLRLLKKAISNHEKVIESRIS